MTGQPVACCILGLPRTVIPPSDQIQDDVGVWRNVFFVNDVWQSSHFFFSSRRRHTRCLSDWSSDVCSSDLLLSTVSQGAEDSSRIAPAEVHYRLGIAYLQTRQFAQAWRHARQAEALGAPAAELIAALRRVAAEPRSEERRVGKECRCGGGRE